MEHLAFFGRYILLGRFGVMIGYQNEYINLVVLGSFNPAILTHAFLVGECGFDLPAEPSNKGPGMPVVASLEYENLSFFADLGRLQIMEKNCADPKVSKVPQYVQTYLDKLPHTPLSKCGANLSCGLTIGSSRLGEVGEWVKRDRGKVCRALKLETVALGVDFVVQQASEVVGSWVLRTKITEYEASTTLKVTVPESGNKVKVNFNYEVAGLDKDRARLASITESYRNLVDLFRDQVEQIFAG